jgi:hypothetical protein
MEDQDVGLLGASQASLRGAVGRGLGVAEIGAVAPNEALKPTGHVIHGFLLRQRRLPREPAAERVVRLQPHR